MTQKPQQSETPPGSIPLRILAHGIDFAVMLPLFFIIETAFQRGDVVKTAFELLIILFYYTAMQGSVWHATVGKRLLKLRVVDKSGQGVSYARALARVLVMALPMAPVLGISLYLMYQGVPAMQEIVNTPEKDIIFQQFLTACLLFSLLLITIWYIPMVFTRQRKGVHDMLCRTRVVRKNT